MPLPWPAGHEEARKRRDSTKLSKEWRVEQRAISLAQLRSLGVLLQRLCKAGLLKAEDGKRLEWSKINQHHIRWLVVMKVIPKENSCSWVELVAEDPQPPKFFVSHNWSEPFRDFMVAIEHHALEVGARSRDTYWICCFAMDQHQVDVGTYLENGPFVNALRFSGSAVLMLDKNATSLSRLWCLLEIYIILTRYKECLHWQRPHLRVLTPMGVLGTPRVVTAPVVEALMNSDSTRAVATVPADRRQILNYIAKRPETTGLKTNRSGDLISPKELDLKTHGKEYEIGLMEECMPHFEEFNSTFHDWVRKQQDTFQMQTSGLERGLLERGEVQRACGRIDPDKRGMTLAQLRYMWRVIKKQCADWERVGRTGDKREAGEVLNVPTPTTPGEGRPLVPPDIYGRITLYDFVWEGLHKDTEEQLQHSYMEYISKEPQEPEYSITVPYAMPFGDVIAAIEWHAEARMLPDTTVYWAWFFSLSLQDLSDWFSKRDGTTPTDIVLKKAGASLEGIVVILDRDLGSFKRLNPVFELYRFLFRETKDKPCDLCCTVGALSTSRPFSGRAYQFGSFDLTAAQAMLDFNILDLEAKTDAEKKRKGEILAEIAEMPPGQSAPESHKNYDAFNIRMRKLGCGPVLREAAFNGDHTQIERVVRSAHISLTTPEVCGEHGDGPLMIAAASGQLKCIETLVRYQADVNRSDAQGETPLHYAALAGQLGSAKLLIRCGARADVVSIFEEKPSDVATQNPAYFLGVRTSKVRRMLRQEEKLACRLAGSIFVDEEEDDVSDDEGSSNAPTDFPRDMQLEEVVDSEKTPRKGRGWLCFRP